MSHKIKRDECKHDNKLRMPSYKSYQWIEWCKNCGAFRETGNYLVSTKDALTFIKIKDTWRKPKNKNKTK